MAGEPSIEQQVEQPRAEAAAEEQETGTGDGLVENFGMQAIVSIALFVAFVVFAILCLPIYIL